MSAFNIENVISGNSCSLKPIRDSRKVSYAFYQYELVSSTLPPSKTLLDNPIMREVIYFQQFKFILTIQLEKTMFCGQIIKNRT